MAKLNLGCGRNRRPGWVNADLAPDCHPDVLMNIEALPWPFADDSFDEVVASHVLEHVGALPRTYLGVIAELYRVCRDGAVITITVPHPRHDDFLNDPTHVRAITAESFLLFSQAVNRALIADGASDSPLGLRLGVDFEVTQIRHQLDAAWQARRASGELDDTAIAEAAKRANNVIQATTVVLRAVKPCETGGRSPPHG